MDGTQLKFIRGTCIRLRHFLHFLHQNSRPETMSRKKELKHFDNLLANRIMNRETEQTEVQSFVDN